MSLVDSHCHLDSTQFETDRDEVVQRALDAGLTNILAIGTGEGPPDLEVAVRLADRHDFVYATVGIHPEYASKAADEHFRHLAELARHPKCVAVGEIGLDYHWEPYDRNRQAEVFTEQLRIAADAGKPVSIHTRDAWDDTVRILREHWVPTGLPCVLHCFTGGPDKAQEALDLGFYLSFAGVVTFPKAFDVQESARMAPLDRILVETDAPFLAPVPYRGKRNEPAFVLHTARKLAQLRGEDEGTVIGATGDNFRRVFLDRLH